MQLLSTKAEKQRIAQNEYPASNFIPYAAHFNNNTIITKSNQLIQVTKLGGFSFETADDEDLDIKKNIRNLLFKGMGAGNLAVYFHIIRKRQQAYHDNYKNTEMPEGFASYLDQKWHNKYKNKKAFSNELYISIIRHNSINFSIIDNAVNLIRRDEANAAWQKSLWEAYEQLEEATGRVLNSLREYNVKLLGIERVDNLYYSEILEFLNKIVNCGATNRVLYTPYRLDNLLSY